MISLSLNYIETNPRRFFYFMQLQLLIEWLAQGCLALDLKLTKLLSFLIITFTEKVSSTLLCLMEMWNGCVLIVIGF